MSTPRVATYLDANAGAPLRPEAAAALRALLDSGSGVLIPNPSSIHSHGRRAKRLVADARECLALSLGARIDPEGLVLTASGTESNQLAVRSVLEPRFARGERPHWITTPVEHDSVLQLVEWARARGGSVSFLAIDENGAPRPESLAALVRPGETALVSAVWVNNETGVITDVKALCDEAKRLGDVPVHLDGAQAWGKLPIDLEAVGARYAAFSGHKIGGLAGTGLLWIGRGGRAHAVIAGKQEKGRRGGTENTLGIVALGAAAGALRPLEWAARVAASRDRLEREVLARVPGAQINAAGAPRVANTSNFYFDGVGGDGLIMALDLAGYSVSSGSACSSGALEPSHVLLALGRTRAQATAALRVSLPDALTEAELEGFVGALAATVARLRTANAWSPGTPESARM